MMMKNLFAIFFFISLFLASNTQAMPRDVRETVLPPYALKNWIQNAIQYQYQLETHDYNRYISEQFSVQHNGEKWNFHQWLHQMTNLKNETRAIEITFNEIVAEENHVATSYVVHMIKKDKQKLHMKVISVCQLKEGKLISCDELTNSQVK